MITTFFSYHTNIWWKLLEKNFNNELSIYTFSISIELCWPMERVTHCPLLTLLVLSLFLHTDILPTVLHHYGQERSHGDQRAVCNGTRWRRQRSGGVSGPAGRRRGRWSGRNEQLCQPLRPPWVGEERGREGREKIRVKMKNLFTRELKNSFSHVCSFFNCKWGRNEADSFYRP